MDAGERALLQSTVRDALERVAPEGAAVVDRVLGELGWLEVLAAEPLAAIEIVFRALGTTNATASVLDDVMVSGLGMAPRAALAVALPRFAASDPPSGNGLATARVVGAEELLVVWAEGDGLSAVCVPASTVEVQAVEGIDPAAGLRTVRVGAGEAGTSTPMNAATWESAVARGRTALAHQIAGACRAMLDLARRHALERVQFDRPIARFQAVRHRLAEGLVAVEALEAVLAVVSDDPLTAALAKAVAGRTARTVGAHCQQVLAGIGFTAEHPFHRFLKRTLVLDGLLGSADDLARDVGRQLLADRHVPTLVDL